MPRIPVVIDWARHEQELPYLSGDVLRGRLAMYLRQANYEKNLAVETAFPRREGVGEPYTGPTGWRQICRHRIHAARIRFAKADYYEHQLTERLK